MSYAASCVYFTAYSGDEYKRKNESIHEINRMCQVLKRRTLTTWFNDKKQHHCLCVSPQPEARYFPCVGSHGDTQAPAARAETLQLPPALSALHVLLS